MPHLASSESGGAVALFPAESPDHAPSCPMRSHAAAALPPVPPRHRRAPPPTRASRAHLYIAGHRPPALTEQPQNARGFDRAAESCPIEPFATRKDVHEILHFTPEPHPWRCCDSAAHRSRQIFAERAIIPRLDFLLRQGFQLFRRYLFHRTSIGNRCDDNIFHKFRAADQCARCTALRYKKTSHLPYAIQPNQKNAFADTARFPL